MATRTPGFSKLVVVANALVPLALLAYDAARGSLGANPVEFALRATGLLALFFLTLSLGVTPARRLLGMPSLAQHRRALGLFAFLYASIHAIVYAVFDRGFSPSAIVVDTVERPFITIGMAGFLMMVPLAATSTNAMIRRLGGKRWRRLHRLAYVVAAAGVVHFYMLVKADVRTPLIYGVVVAGLLLLRVAAAVAERRRRAPATTGH